MTAAPRNRTDMAVLAALLGGLLASCGRSTPPDAGAVADKAAAEASAAERSKVDAEMLAALAPAPGQAPAVALSAEQESAALRVMRDHPEMNAQELLNVPEVNGRLVEALKGLSSDPQLQAAINKSVDLAAYFKGLEGPPGSYKLNLDVTAYDDARTERMLTAVMSGRPRPVVEFLLEELGEASFEFSFTDADKTANGISLEKNPGAPAAKPPQGDPD